LILMTYALLWYGDRLERKWEIEHRAAFTFKPWLWWAALSVFLLAGVVLTLAARFPFPRPRYAWGRLVIAALVVLPAIHLTLFVDGWTKPHWLFQPWWFDDLSIGMLSAVLAGVAVGCGFGARRERG
jgi:hypothetical protein